MDKSVNLQGTWEKMPMFNLLNFVFEYDDEKLMCMITTEVNEYMLNPLGTIHGGIFAYIADTAIGHALKRFQDAPFVSLELSSQFYRTVSSGKIIAKASFVKSGYKICFMTCPIFDEQGQLLSETKGTFYRKSL